MEKPTAAPAADPSRVHDPEVTLAKNEEGQWRFFLDGSEFFIRGAGGAIAPGLLEALRDAGGNCVRTWGVETLEQDVDDGERFIDRAHRLGLKVVPGIWVQHERHGFDYSDPEMVHKQREEVIAGVRTFKDHPAVLAWGLGNEMEGPSSRTGSIPVYKELETLIQLVKDEDPDHPVMSIIAFNPAKIEPIMKHCPSLDILGINSYGGAATAGPALKEAGWTKPFAVTEFGVRGFWEVDTTAWGAPLEPTSYEKARSYYATHRLVTDLNEGRDLCLGTFAFLWGWKQERTATWFGMFLPTLEKLPSVDAMTRVWTGEWPSNRCPRIERVSFAAAGGSVEPDRTVSAKAYVTDPEGDEVAYEWILRSESTARSEGGDAEASPPSHPDRMLTDDARECVFRTPKEPGPYRLFLTVRDGHGSAATANVPFRVLPSQEN